MSPKRQARVSNRKPLGKFEDYALIYSAVVASALDAVIVVDEEGVVVIFNPAAEATFGYTSDEAIGRDIGSLIVPEHLKAAHHSGMNRYKMTGKPHVLGRRVEMDARCKDGRIIPVELAITEVKLQETRLFTANLRDLSAAKAAAMEIDRQREALHQNKKLAAIGSLMAGVAHELNNPLAIVLGQSTLLREEMNELGSDPKISARAGKIEAAAERCAKIVRSFLAIARQRKAEKRNVPVDATLDGALELVSYALQSNGIKIKREIGHPDSVILVDPDQVQQILVNLLVNAIQVLEGIDGHREIAIRTAVSHKGFLDILVSDNGPGVLPNVAPLIFDPFFTTKPQGAGTGIGLSISRGLAETQGGQLYLDTSTGEGATFVLRLPLASRTGEDRTDSQPHPSLALGSNSTNHDAPLGLVVDDEQEIAELLADALKRVGYNCDATTTGRGAQALINAKSDQYQVILCDLRMPEINGPNAL